jgi:hypothetical protein
VRSFIAWRLGLEQAALPLIDRQVVAMLLDATQRVNQPLTAERLSRWHAAMLLTGYSGLYQLLEPRGTRGPRCSFLGRWAVNRCTTTRPRPRT